MLDIVVFDLYLVLPEKSVVLFSNVDLALALVLKAGVCELEDGLAPLRQSAHGILPPLARGTRLELQLLDGFFA